MTATAETEGYQTVADLVDHLPAYAARPDVPLFVEAARASGGPVLELGCGTGRVLMPTARAGVEVTGLDLSPPMLRVCRDALIDEPPQVRRRITLVQGDMRRFDLGRRFALITIPFRPFQHLLTVEDQVACLACVRRHLAPGGRFILDVFNPSLEALTDPARLTERASGEPFTTPDGRSVTATERIVSRDLARQVLDVELVYYVTGPDGRSRRLVHRLKMRYFFRYEMEHLLARSGFRIEAVYGDYDKSAFGAKAPGELICVAGMEGSSE